MSTVAAARAAYFAANGFSEAAYHDSWVVLRAAGIPVMIMPSTEGRARALPLHDLHHVATGYPTTWIGEGEIGAWELAAGCADFHAARLYDFAAFAGGLVLAPRRMYRAFLRGRRSRSLYRAGLPDGVLAWTVDELRRHLHLDVERPPTWRDRLAFAGWALLVALPPVGALVVALV